MQSSLLTIIAGLVLIGVGLVMFVVVIPASEDVVDLFDVENSILITSFDVDPNDYKTTSFFHPGDVSILIIETNPENAEIEYVITQSDSGFEYEYQMSTGIAIIEADLKGQEYYGLSVQNMSEEFTTQITLSYLDIGDVNDLDGLLEMGIILFVGFILFVVGIIIALIGTVLYFKKRK